MLRMLRMRMQVVPSTPFPTWMRELLREVMPLCGFSEEEWPNACNVNLYVGGDGLSWHADAARPLEWLDCRLVATVDLGLDMQDLDVCSCHRASYIPRRTPKDEPLFETSDGNICIISLSLGQVR